MFGEPCFTWLRQVAAEWVLKTCWWLFICVLCSPVCVCVCVCVGVWVGVCRCVSVCVCGVCIFCIVMLEPLSTLCVRFSVYFLNFYC